MSERSVKEKICIKNFVVTGRPGSGKTTIVMRVAEEMRNRGFIIRGILTPEIRVKGSRTGFAVRAIDTGEERIFASIRFRGYPRVGKYGVRVDIFESVALPALDRALEGDIILIDEIGKMELLSETFVKAVYRALDSPKIVLATMGKGLGHPIETTIKRRRDTRVFFVNKGLESRIINMIVKYLIS